MNYKDLIISKLLNCNYAIFIPVNSEPEELVINLKGELKFCLCRPTRDTGRGPNLIFSKSIDAENYDYIIAVEKETKRCWLIPVADLDFTKKSMMLSSFAQGYSLVPQETIISRVIKKKKEKEVKKVIKRKVAEDVKLTPVQTNEDIMNLLNR